MEFNNRTLADIYLITDHRAAQGGPAVGFDLSAEVLGALDAARITPSGQLWYYTIGQPPPARWVAGPLWSISVRIEHR